MNAYTGVKLLQNQIKIEYSKPQLQLTEEERVTQFDYTI